MSSPETCEITYPLDDATFYLLPGATTVTFNTVGTTDATTPVELTADGVAEGDTTSDGDGDWTIETELELGDWDLEAIAGTDPDTTPSEVVTVHVALPTLPTGLMTAEWYANWLCGAVTGVGTLPPYTLGDALKRWCGLDPADTLEWLNTSYVDALNDRQSIPGSVRKSARQVLNIIAGTTGLPMANALKIICEGELP